MAGRSGVTRFSGEQKLKMIRDHLVKGVPVSEICETYQIAPSQFFNWQKSLFDHGSDLFDRRKKGASNPLKAKSQSKKDQKIADLEAKLAQKNSVIAELMEDNISLRKKSTGAN